MCDLLCLLCEYPRQRGFLFLIAILAQKCGLKQRDPGFLFFMFAATYMSDSEFPFLLFLPQSSLFLTVLLSLPPAFILDPYFLATLCLLLLPCIFLYSHKKKLYVLHNISSDNREIFTIKTWIWGELNSEKRVRERSLRLSICLQAVVIVLKIHKDY